MQATIAAAIVGIMLAVLMTVVGNLSDMTGNLSAKEELDIVMEKVKNALLTEDSCANALNPIVGSPILFNGANRTLQQVSVRDSFNTTLLPLIQRGQMATIDGTVQNPGGGLTRRSYTGKIRIDDITLEEVSPGTGRSVERLNIPNPVTGLPFTDYNTYVGKVVVRSSYNGRVMAERTVGLKLFTNAAGDLQKCFSLATDTESCSAFSGTVDANGRCQLPECSAATIAAWVAQGRGRDCWGGGNCVPRNPGYFWVFRGGEGNTLSAPICICLEDCS